MSFHKIYNARMLPMTENQLPPLKISYEMRFRWCAINSKSKDI